MDRLNSHADYYTTSSCSGRVALFVEGGSDGSGGSPWLFVSHDPLCEEMIATRPCSLLSSARPRMLGCRRLAPETSEWRLVSLKFEPYIAHVEARNWAAANELLQAALQAGFRNSGMVVGRHEATGQREPRFMIAIRSTLKLDAPVAVTKKRASDEDANGDADDVEWLVDEEYLRVLLTLVNDKFAANGKSAARLIAKLDETLKNKEATA